jgi:hypothetical protein
MAPWIEPVFEFLFKYRPFLFQKGRFVMAPPWPAAIVLVVGAAAVVISYQKAKGGSGMGPRLTLAVLRTAALALVLFCLCRPALVLSTVVPQQSFLGVLVDDSQSMRIADDGETRGQVAARSFGPEAPLAQGPRRPLQAAPLPFLGDGGAPAQHDRAHLRRRPHFADAMPSSARARSSPPCPWPVSCS